MKSFFDIPEDRRWEFRRWGVFAIGVLGAMAAAPYYIPPDNSNILLASAVSFSHPEPLSAPPSVAAPLFLPCESQGAAHSLAARWTETTVPSRTTFAAMMQRNGLNGQQVAEAVEACRGVFDLHRLRAGQKYFLGYAEDDTLAAWKYAVDEERTLVLRWKDGSAEAWMESHPLDWRPMSFSAVINRSLFESLAPADSELAVKVAEVFAWEVDFYHELRQGDRIDVLYEAAYCGETRRRTGRVLAARLTLSGQPREAYLFSTGQGAGYYDARGKSLKRQFLKMPLKYGRFTSGFTSRRKHPVHGGYRPHYGVDYAAPTGTPVFATADGTVLAVARGRGEGNYVHLRHANGYETMYLHLSRFARGIHSGRRVAQGETIGYVGSTGASTGPHVDYRIRQHGRWLNPRQMQVPPAPPLPPGDEDAFFRNRDYMAHLLDLTGRETSPEPRRAAFCPSHPATAALAGMLPHATGL